MIKNYNHNDSPALTWKLGTLEKSEKFSSLVLLSPPKDVDLAENLPEQKDGSW